jgi:hypothetical protein
MTQRLSPSKYYKGLSKKQQTRRMREIKKFGAKSWKDPAAYVGFETDKGVKTKSSSYTQKWKALFPDAKSIPERAKASGIPESILRECYNRGMAAWRTGHRPSATQQQWGYARMSSLALCGKTHYTADADLVRKARATSKSARKWFTRCAKKGGYRATAKNKKYLALYKKGKSIGFTMKASLKAKGLIPRADGTYKVSEKYL